MKTYKLIIVAAFLLMDFTVGDSKSEYLVPSGSVSVFGVDLDLDNDIDIVVGSNYFPQTEWSGITFLENDSYGYFNLIDSINMYASQNIIYSVNIKGDEYAEIIGRYHDGQQTNVAIIELNNGNYNISYYPMSNNLTDFMYGDISGNGAYDFAFISNNDFLWGIIYNDGTGNFSPPQYFDLDFPPVDINCADLNGDGKDDVVVCGMHTEIYYYTETGFEKQVLTTTTSHDVLLSDFDNDGDLDIITHRTLIYPTHRVFFFENLGNNVFYQHPHFDFSPFCSYAQIADFDNDSLPDMVFISSDHTGLHIYNNTGNFQLEYQQFIPHENLTLQGLFCEDYDNNGFQDIAFTSGFGQIDYYLNILFNDGQGNFIDNPITSITQIYDNKRITISSYPNPFKKETTIKFQIEENSYVELFVYNLSGRLIKSLTSKKMKGGIHSIKWSGADMTGKDCGPGSYIACLKANKEVLHCIKLIKY